MIRNKSEQRLKRRVSFTTASMAMGVMPERVGLRDPTINVIMTCDKLPELEDIANVIKTMFQYHRLASVPVREDGSAEWSFETVGTIDPLKMVREVNMTCDTKEEWAEIVQDQQKQSIRRIDLPWFEFVLMNNEGAGDNVLLFRIDHCVADGFSLGKIFSSVLKKGDGSTFFSLIPPSMVSNKQKVNRKKICMILKTLPLGPVLKEWMDQTIST